MARLEQARLLGGLRRRACGPVRRFALGCYLLELLDRLAPEDGAPSDEAPPVPPSRWRPCGRWSRPRARPAALRTLLGAARLDALGLRPELRLAACAAARAGRRSPPGFHVAEGGPVCGACARPRAHLGGWCRAPGHPARPRAGPRDSRLSDRSSTGSVLTGPAALAEARQLVHRFQRFHVGVELRSERFLDDLMLERNG